MANNKQINIRLADLADSLQLGELCKQLGYPTSAKVIEQRLHHIQQHNSHAVYVAESAEGAEGAEGAEEAGEAGGGNSQNAKAPKRQSALRCQSATSYPLPVSRLFIYSSERGLNLFLNPLLMSIPNLFQD